MSERPITLADLEAYERATAETERTYASWVAAVGLGAIASAEKAYWQAVAERKRAYRALGSRAPLPGRGALTNDGEYKSIGGGLK